MSAAEALEKALERIEEMPGWFSSETAEFYRRALMTAPQGGMIVEVGVSFGKSLAWLAEMARAQWSEKHLYIIGVDSWLPTAPEFATDVEGLALVKRHGSPFEAFVHTMAKHATEAADYVWKTLPMMSLEAARVAGEKGWKPWAVMLDGSHAHNAVRADIEAWWPLIQEGGMLGGTHREESDRAAEKWYRDSKVRGVLTVAGNNWWIQK